MLELTRAANYVCDAVRRFISPIYRRAEGALLVQSGPMPDLTFVTSRVEYHGDERVLCPYPGLEEFLVVRTRRDSYFGATDHDE